MFYDIKMQNMESVPRFHPNPDLKLMDQVCEVLRYHHYAYRTEQTYCQWILHYLHFFGGKTHPKEFDSYHVERFLSSLATKSKVSVSTQKQALNALVFLYRSVLDLPLKDKIGHIRAKRQAKPPTVLTQEEVQRLLQKMDGTHALMAKLLYGSGLRLMGCHTLRHRFATHMLENGVNIRTLQTLLGHADVKTTEIYTHVMQHKLNELQSPLDNLIEG